MGKHAYLIIANRNPNQLKLLLKTLDDSRNDIYLLLDKKSKNIFQDKYLLNFSPVYMIKPINIYWGDYFQIQAELNLFSAACNKNYDYYHLLSGLDLPLVNQDIIHNFFDKNPNKEFITYSVALTPKQLQMRIHNHHFTKSFRSNNKVLKLYHKIENKVYSVIPERKIPIEKIKFGSNWVSLENNIVNDLVKNINEIKSLYFKEYLVDEIFIPTFINLHPSYKEKIYYKKPVHDKPEEFQGNLRYINWWDGSPYVWTINDYSKLEKAVKMGHLFSRKFDENIDNKIIYKIVEQDLR